MRLLEAIFGLDEHQLAQLAARWRIALDPQKRLTLAEQVARGMVDAPRWIDVSKLEEGAAETLRLLLAAPHGLPATALPAGHGSLLAEGLLFRDPARPERLLIPSAFRLQLPGSPSDSPRAARLLLLSVPEEARRELCQHHLRRLPPLPWPMLMETVLERLEDPAWVKRQLGELQEHERGLLAAIDAHGGEAGGEEVLALSREPMRIAHSGALQVPRRSAIFALARRGLVLATHRGWQIPDEVERLVGRERRARAGMERQRLLMSRHVHELTPARAELADPVGPMAVAVVAALHSAGQLPRAGCGVSRMAVRRLAAQLHLAEGQAELLACLVRADGLAYANETLQSATERIWSAWRRGGAWDEAAREPDQFRPGHPATARATALVREALLDTLLLLPSAEFALQQDVEAATSADRRALSAQRALSQAERAGQAVLGSVADVVRVLLEATLPWLGLVDRGRVEQGAVVRLSSQARKWLTRPQGDEERQSCAERAAVWVADLRLVCGSRCDATAIIEAAGYASVWLDDRAVGLAFTPDQLSAAADHDPDLAGLRASLSTLTPHVPTALERAMREATAERPMTALVRCGGFIGIDDPAVRDALYTDPEAAPYWAAPPLSSGLLVRAGVPESRLAQLLKRHGIRLHTGI